MRKRVLLAVLSGAALLVAPVAGVEAKPDGDGSKCKTKEVGFKVKGTLVEASDLTTIEVAVIRTNRHADDWLGEFFPTSNPTFDISGVSADKIKFVGVTDRTFDGTVDFEDAVGEQFRVKLKAKLTLPKHGCEDEAVLVVKKIKVKATETD